MGGVGAGGGGRGGDSKEDEVTGMRQWIESLKTMQCDNMFMSTKCVGWVRVTDAILCHVSISLVYCLSCHNTSSFSGIHQTVIQAGAPGRSDPVDFV